MTDATEPSTAKAPGRSSRRVVLLGAGAAAALGGFAVARWTGRSTPAGAAAEPFPGFWAQSWDTPQGGVLQLQSLRGRPLLVNFWATWCPPCIEELPLINDFYRRNKAQGWQVIGLAIDRPAAVQGFLQKMPLEFPVGLAGMTGAELGNKLGNPSGSLPFSVALDSQGGVAQRKLGRLHAEDLQQWSQVK